MDTNNSAEMLANLQAELQKLKETDPEGYLELLKTLNTGIEKINSEMGKALGQ